MHLTVDTRPPESWARIVAELRGNIFHSVGWSRISESAFSRPLFFTWTSAGGRIDAVAIGMERRAHIPAVGRWLKRLEFETYPAVRDSSADALEQTLRAVVGFARDGRFMAIEIGSFMAPQPCPAMAGMGLHLHRRTEFVMDLTASDDTLLKGFSSHQRRKHRKAEKHGLEFREATTLDAMKEFRELQVRSRDRRLERGEDIGVLEDSYYEEIGRKYFAHDLGRVFLATHEGEPVSAAFVSIYGGRALYVYGGSSDAGFRLDAPAFLFWNIFRRCRDLNCTEFNLGGVPADAESPDHPSNGLYRFKAGFGGRVIPCVSGSSEDLRPILRRARQLAARIRR